METRLIDVGFKDECNDYMRNDSDYIIDTIIYNPATYMSTYTFKRNDDTVDSNEVVLELLGDIKYGYETYEVNANNMFTIVSCNNIPTKDLMRIYEILSYTLAISHVDWFLNKLDTIAKIYNAVTNSENGVDVELCSYIGSPTNSDIVTLEEYVLGKDDSPYFKIKSNVTALIPCNVLLERFIKILD